ncbi:TPA: hypothetical protein N0F65_011583, partial [Lagenidium giganteum]
ASQCEALRRIACHRGRSWTAATCDLEQTILCWLLLALALLRRCSSSSLLDFLLPAHARTKSQTSPKMNKFLIRGLGFFNDAYDLFVMNIINIVLTEQYTKHVYTANMKSAVSAAALIGAVIGQLLFGYLGDMFGRRVNMIATCVLLIFGGILCTVAYGGSAEGTLWFLVIA